MSFLENQLRGAVPAAVNLILGNGLLRKQAAKYALKYMYRKIVEEDSMYTRNIRLERYNLLSNLINSLERVFAGKLAPTVRKKLLSVFVGGVLLPKQDKARHDNFVREFGQEAPGFIALSPGKHCNLHCTGCYAGSGANSSEKLDYATAERIVREKTDLWGCFPMVISGGEPLMWKSDGKGVLDLCRDHPDNLFHMYTNGTLITPKMAKEIAEVGNLYPAISVEGFEKETDERRGKGVFAKVLEAMSNLREAGVPFGISATATRKNVEAIVSDEFVDFFFGKQKAAWGWLFQYMPIGRSQTIDLMITPQQRLWMFEKEKHFIKDKKVFFADFWNGGYAAGGCFAAGRSGGYIYIDWNGTVSPCAFYPYSKDNIKDIYAGGGNLNDVLKSDLMVGIRKWQREYGFEKTGKDVKNLMAPCGIRDHYSYMHAHIEKTKAVPIDSDAAEAVTDKQYYDGLVKYNETFNSMTEPVWQKEFIGEENAEGGQK